MKKKTLLLFTTIAITLLLFFPVSIDAKVKINKKAVTMTVGQTIKLKVKGTKKKVKWKSKKKAIVTVSKKGKLTAKKAGKTTIIAKLGSKKYTCKVTVKAPETSQEPTSRGNIHLGTREKPIDISKGYTFTFSTLSTNSYTVRLKLLEVIDPADQIVASENSYNATPDGTNRWILYHYKLDYISGTDELNATDVINRYNLYNADSTLNIGYRITDTAAFSDNYKGLDPYDVKMYPGGSSDVWMGILIDKSIAYTTQKLSWYDSDDNFHELWFRNL